TPTSPGSLAVSHGGGTVYVTGYSYDATGHSDYATVAYNAATGATLWGKRYKGLPNGYDNAAAVAVSPGGGTVYVTGVQRWGHLGPGLPHGRLRCRHRRHAVGQALPRPPP